MRRNNDGLSPGDIGDPVADSIRAEQNRDAMPTAEERARMAAKDRTCENCDVTASDVESRSLIFPDCPSIQHPPKPFEMLCDECAESRQSLEESALERARDHNDDNYHETEIVAVAFFECGRSYQVEKPEVPTTEVERQVGWDDETDEPITEMVEMKEPRQYPTRAEVPIECDCGADLADIQRLEDNE